MVQGQWAHHLQPHSPEIADFLAHLRQGYHLSTSDIKVYKAMLNSIFSIRGLDLNKDHVLKDIIRGCSSQPCRPDRELSPSWNLDVVLRFLTMAPLNPLGSPPQKTSPGRPSFCSLYLQCRGWGRSKLSRTGLAGSGWIFLSFIFLRLLQKLTQ